MSGPLLWGQAGFEGELQAVNKASSAAALGKLEFQAVLPGLWFQESVNGHRAQLQERQGSGYPTRPDDGA